MTKAYRFVNSDGSSLTVEANAKQVGVNIVISDGGHEHTVHLTRAEWTELCDLKYVVEFKTEPLRPVSVPIEPFDDAKENQ